MTAPLPETSAAASCGGVSVTICTRCFEICEASNEVIALFVPPVLEGVTVYAPAPNPFSV